MAKKLTTLLLLLLTLCFALPALAETDFAFDRSILSLYEGEQLQLTLLRQKGALADEPITYSSSSPQVATVDSNGLVTGISKGQVTIKASMKVDKKTYNAAINLTVQRAVTEISINEVNLTVCKPGDPMVEGLLSPMEDSDAADWDILVLSVGAERALKVSALPQTASDRRVTVTTTNNNIVRVSGTSLVPRMAGECEVSIASRSNPDVMKNYRVLVLQPVKSIKVTSAAKTVGVGGTVQLTADVQPATASIKAVTWSSSDDRIATVDDQGVVTGVKKGSVTLKATAADGSKRTGTVQVQVVQQPTGITLSDPSPIVAVGSYKTLSATVQPANANDKSVVWSSSNEGVAKVNSSGRITPVSAGECVITAACKNFPEVSASADLTVTQPLTKISFTEKEVYVNVDSTVQVYWTTAPADATDHSVILSSNNQGIAYVDQDGVIHGVKRGAATITATAADGSHKKATIKVNVLQPVTGVHMKNDSVTVDVEEPTTLTAVLEPADASDTRMTWYSDDTRILTVKGSKNRPTVTGHAWGDTTITGVTEDGGYTTTAYIHVGNYDKALAITDLYLQDNEVKITVRNLSNMTISRFYFRITMYDLYGEPMPCNTVGTNVFDGSYASRELGEGESTNHGRFTFNGFVQPGEAIGKVEMRLTGYVTTDGYSRNIWDDRQPCAEYTSPSYIGPLPPATEPPVGDDPPVGAEPPAAE